MVKEYIIVYPSGVISYLEATEYEAILFFESKKQFSRQATLWCKFEYFQEIDPREYLVVYPGGSFQGFRVSRDKMIGIFNQRRIASPQASLWYSVEAAQNYRKERRVMVHSSVADYKIKIGDGVFCVLLAASFQTLMREVWKLLTSGTPVYEVYQDTCDRGLVIVNVPLELST